jgi:hypothetical protein
MIKILVGPGRSYRTFGAKRKYTELKAGEKNTCIKIYRNVMGLREINM